MAHPLDRSGIASLSDLQTPEWKELFRLLEGDQAEFLARQGEFLSPEYQWPRDPLHTWSRLWEYPYVYRQLATWRSGNAKEMLPRLADVGSGVTFFPFAVARLGFDVTCADTDPICARDIPKAARVLPQSPGAVQFRLIAGDRLPFVDSEVDVVVCVSVLEHIPEFEQTVVEMARILKAGGMLVLTIDLDLRGDSEIGVKRYEDLLLSLGRYFQWEQPDRTVHPADQLTSVNGPLAEPARGLWSRVWFESRQLVKRMMGRPPRQLVPFELAVQGLVLRKRMQESDKPRHPDLR